MRVLILLILLVITSTGCQQNNEKDYDSFTEGFISGVSFKQEQEDVFIHFDEQGLKIKLLLVSLPRNYQNEIPDKIMESSSDCDIIRAVIVDYKNDNTANGYVYCDGQDISLTYLQNGYFNHRDGSEYNSIFPITASRYKDAQKE